MINELLCESLDSFEPAPLENSGAMAPKPLSGAAKKAAEAKACREAAEAKTAEEEAFSSPQPKKRSQKEKETAKKDTKPAKAAKVSLDEELGKEVADGFATAANAEEVINAARVKAQQKFVEKKRAEADEEAVQETQKRRKVSKRAAKAKDAEEASEEMPEKLATDDGYGVEEDPDDAALLGALRASQFGAASDALAQQSVAPQDLEEDDDEDEPLLVLKPAAKPAKTRIALDSDDENEELLIVKNEAPKLAVSSIPIILMFPFRSVELHVKEQYYNLSLEGKRPKMRIAVPLQTAVPVKISTWQKEAKDYAEVILELKDEELKMLDNFDRHCGKLFRKADGKREVPWKLMCNPEALKPSCDDNEPVQLVKTKLMLSKQPTEIALRTKDGKFVTGAGLQFFREHEHYLQNVKVLGILEFPSLYYYGSANYGAMSAPVWKEILITVLPKKERSSGNRGMSMEKIRALLG